MGEKLLSIIIPSYNTSRYIDSTLPSILEHEYNNLLEIIIINDGSTDATKEKAERFYKLYPDVVKVVNKENGGHGSGINRGIQEARGHFFKVIDGDDYVETRELIRFLNQIKNIDADVIISPYTTVSAMTSVEKIMMPTNFRFVKKENGIEYNRLYDSDNILPYIYGTIHAITYKTSLLKEHFSDVKVSEKIFYEDNEYCLFPMAFVNKVYLSDCNVYRYVIDQANQSVSSENRKKRIDHQIMVMENILIHYKKLFLNNSSEVTKDYAYRVIGRHVYSIFETYMLFNDNALKRRIELKNIDQKIKRECRDVYLEANIYPVVKMMRLSNYFLYRIIRRYLQKRWNK